MNGVLLVCLIMCAAAVLEVGGDAAIYSGLTKPRALAPVIGGCVALAFYGLALNLVKAQRIADAEWPFYRLLGVYVPFFALISLAWYWRPGRSLPLSALAGFCLIALGGLLIYRAK